MKIAKLRTGFVVGTVAQYVKGAVFAKNNVQNYLISLVIHLITLQ
jgi:hypothetical protein